MTRIIENIGGLVVPDEGLCSFCRAEGPVVRSNMSGKAICWMCVYNALVATEAIPNGSVYCFSCKEYSGFSMYQGSTKVSWRFAGLDRYEEVVYQVFHTTSQWTRGTAVSKLICSSCNAELPLWMQDVNKYVKS